MRELETTVEHLRRIYHDEVDAVKEDNKKLRNLLDAHGIHYELSAASTSQNYTTPVSSGFAHSPPSGFGGSQTHSTGFTSVSPRTQAIGMQMNLSRGMPTSSMSSGYSVQQTAAGPVIQPGQGAMVPGMDYSEMGVDFVWKYGRTPYLSPPPNQ
jgi:hypothetical protein